MDTWPSIDPATDLFRQWWWWLGIAYPFKEDFGVVHKRFESLNVDSSPRPWAHISSQPLTDESGQEAIFSTFVRWNHHSTLADSLTQCKSLAPLSAARVFLLLKLRQTFLIHSYNTQTFKGNVASAQVVTRSCQSRQSGANFAPPLKPDGLGGVVPIIENYQWASSCILQLFQTMPNLLLVLNYHHLSVTPMSSCQSVLISSQD